MNLTTPASVQKLQTALHDKAKGIAQLSLLRPCTIGCIVATRERTGNVVQRLAEVSGRGVNSGQQIIAEVGAMERQSYLVCFG